MLLQITTTILMVTLTLRAQLTKSSSLVMTYSPLLLSADAGLAANAVLFSLTGTRLHEKVNKCTMRSSAIHISYTSAPEG